MMISSITYVEKHKDASYNTLIDERNKLMELIKEYETKEKAGDRSRDEWDIYPRPDVRYQVHLEYLAELCLMMKDIFCE